MGTGGKRVRASSEPGHRSRWLQDLSTQTWAKPCGGPERVPSGNYCALSWGAGECYQVVNKNGNAKLCSKPLPVFKQFKATKSSGETEYGLGQQANHFSPCILFPSSRASAASPKPLCRIPTSLCAGFPLSSDPRWQGGWWKGMGDAGLGACLGLATGTPVSESPAPQSVCPCAQGCPRVLGCTHKHRGMLLWLPQTPAWLLASPLRLPLPWKAQPTLLLGQTEAPLVFLPPLCSIQLTAL